MSLKYIPVTAFLLFLTFRIPAQLPLSADSVMHQPAGSSITADRAGYRVKNTNDSACIAIPRLSCREYLTLLGSNLQQDFTSPFT